MYTVEDIQEVLEFLGSLVLSSNTPTCSKGSPSRSKPVSSLTSRIAASSAVSLPGFHLLPAFAVVSWNPPGNANLLGSDFALAPLLIIKT